MSDYAQLFFEDRDLAELRKIFLRTCRALAIEGPHRAYVREHVANVVMQVACSGERDPAVIEQRVLRHFEKTKTELVRAASDTLQNVSSATLESVPHVPWLRKLTPA